jgi:hypothetical protein
LAFPYWFNLYVLDWSFLWEWAEFGICMYWRIHLVLWMFVMKYEAELVRVGSSYSTFASGRTKVCNLCPEKSFYQSLNSLERDTT